MLRSRTWSSLAAAAWSLYLLSGPNPVQLRHAVTSKEEVGQYRELSAQAAYMEGRLAVVLRRFPLPNSVFAAATGGARNDVRDGIRDNCGDAHRPAAVNVVVVPGDDVLLLLLLLRMTIMAPHLTTKLSNASSRALSEWDKNTNDSLLPIGRKGVSDQRDG